MQPETSKKTSQPRRVGSEVIGQFLAFYSCGIQAAIRVETAGDFAVITAE